MNILKKIYRTQLESTFDGKGFTQGIGFNVKVIAMYIFGIRFIKEVKFDGTPEWLRDLKKRIEVDNKQQELERNNNNNIQCDKCLEDNGGFEPPYSCKGHGSSH